MNPRPTAKKLNRTGRNTPARNSTTVCTTAARKQIVDMMRRARSTKGLDFTLSRVARKTGSAPAHQSEEFMRSYVFGIAIKSALLSCGFVHCCAAGDATFSNDGERIFAICDDDNAAICELNLMNYTFRKNSFPQLPDQTWLRGIAQTRRIRQSFASQMRRYGRSIRIRKN